MINEFGEEITDEQMTSFAARLRKLSGEEIDDLFFQSCIIADHPVKDFEEALSEIERRRMH